MIRSLRIQSTLAALSLCLVHAGATCAETLDQRVDAAIAQFEGAENRFQQPSQDWFETTRQPLIEETQRVDQALESHGRDYAQAWKDHLRWPYLTDNLGESSTVNLDELAKVRRWLYSNREGLEYPFFAELRKRIDAHLDAAYVATHSNLEAAFVERVAQVRNELNALRSEPNDQNAAALGRTLGWFERTRQLTDEVATTRELASRPNARIFVRKPLLDRAIALLATDVEQSLPVSDRVNVPNASLLGRARTVNVRGTASTEGAISLKLLENASLADLQLIYLGDIVSRCTTVVGPVTVAMKTAGPVRAVTPVQLSLAGVHLNTTDVDPDVYTRVTNVSAKNELFRRIGKRRISEPESKRQMNSRASYKAAKLLQEEMDERVVGVIDDIKAELQSARSSFDNFAEVLAPVVREGATPRWDGMQTTSDAVIVNGISQRREQLGSPVEPAESSITADIEVHLHTSFFNNMLETIMAGKTFTDRYFMRYGRILQAELPPQLMVHARSARWAVIAAKPRPLEISIPASNQFRIELRLQAVEIGEERFTGPSTLTVDYTLVQNEYDEYQLERQGNLQLNSPLPSEQQEFLHAKMSAFFAPVLNAGGVALPEGGSLGRLRSLQPQGVSADRNWLTLGVNLPTEFLEEWLPIPEATATAN